MSQDLERSVCGESERCTAPVGRASGLDVIAYPKKALWRSQFQLYDFFVHLTPSSRISYRNGIPFGLSTSSKGLALLQVFVAHPSGNAPDFLVCTQTVEIAVLCPRPKDTVHLAHPPNPRAHPAARGKQRGVWRGLSLEKSRATQSGLTSYT